MTIILCIIIYFCLGYLYYTWKRVRGKLMDNWLYIKKSDQRFVLIVVLLFWVPILIGEGVKKILENIKK